MSESTRESNRLPKPVTMAIWGLMIAIAGFCVFQLNKVTNEPGSKHKTNSLSSVQTHTIQAANDAISHETRLTADI